MGATDSDASSRALFRDLSIKICVRSRMKVSHTYIEATGGNGGAGGRASATKSWISVEAPHRIPSGLPSLSSLEDSKHNTSVPE